MLELLGLAAYFAAVFIFGLVLMVYQDVALPKWWSVLIGSVGTVAFILGLVADIQAGRATHEPFENFG